MDDDDLGTSRGNGDNTTGGERRGPRPRGAMTGGWGFEGDGGAGGGGAVGGRLSVEPPSPAGAGGRHFDGDDDVVPTIPDLEEEAEEDITRQVAAPPTAGATYHQPVRSVRELDTALSSRASQLPASPEEGVDLAPLMQCLCSERQVFEADTTWDHELIFQEVASAINSDLTVHEEGTSEDNNDHFQQVGAG
mmetsp:Transcript_69781/g.161450  ORF Transcript_69781/g.161450 Transcript_69781/m.161450 type:complete len:192 (+) Transcript_69781:67-642(+)